MKKNKMMRLASFLLVAVLMTTSVISGTFAKYVTTDTADDTARVAMFGVKIETSGSLFSENYKAATDNTPGTNDPSTGGTAKAGITVHSAGKLGGTGTAEKDKISNVVAPGTKNTDGMVFSVTGTPEVNVNVELKVNTESASDVWLGQGLNYPNMTTGEVFDTSAAPENAGEKATRQENVTFTNSNYYPIKYTLEHSSTGTAGSYSAVAKVNTSTGQVEKDVYLTNVNLSDIVDYLDWLSKSATTTYPAGTDLSSAFGFYKLTWEWAFENNASGGDTNSDKQDTLLGDLASDKYGSTNIVTQAINALKAAGLSTPDPDLTEIDSSSTTKTKAAQNKYSLEANLEFTITVTQVD